MPAAPNGQRQMMCAGEFEARRDINCVDAPCNQRWSPVDPAIPNAARCIVLGISQSDDGASDLPCEISGEACIRHALGGYVIFPIFRSSCSTVPINPV